MRITLLLILQVLASFTSGATEDDENDPLITIHDPKTDTTHVILEDIVREMEFNETDAISASEDIANKSVLDTLLEKLDIPPKGPKEDERAKYKTFEFKSVDPLLRYLVPKERARILPLFLDPYIDTGRGWEVDSRFPRWEDGKLDDDDDKIGQFVIDAFGKMTSQLVKDIRSGALRYEEAVPASLKRSLLREWYRRPDNRSLQNIFFLLVMAMDVVERHRGGLWKNPAEANRLFLHSFGWVEDQVDLDRLLHLYLTMPERTEWLRHFEGQLKRYFDRLKQTAEEGSLAELIKEFLQSRCCPRDSRPERMLELVRVLGPQRIPLSWNPLAKRAIRLWGKGRRRRREVLAKIPIDQRILLLNAILRQGRPSEGDWEIFEDLRWSLQQFEAGEELLVGLIWGPTQYAMAESSNPGDPTSLLCKHGFPICETEEVAALFRENIISGHFKEPSTISTLVAIFEVMQMYNLTAAFERLPEEEIPKQVKSDEAPKSAADRAFASLAEDNEISSDEIKGKKGLVFANIASFLHLHTIMRGRVGMDLHKKFLSIGGRQFRSEIMSNHLYLELFDFRAVPLRLLANRQEYIRGTIGALTEILWMGKPVVEASSSSSNLPPIPILWGDYAQSTMAMAFRNGASLKEPELMSMTFATYINGLTALTAQQGILGEAGLTFLTRNFCQGFLLPLETYAFDRKVRWRSVHFRLLVSRLTPPLTTSVSDAKAANRATNMQAMAGLLDRLVGRRREKDEVGHLTKWLLRFGIASSWWEWPRYVRAIISGTKLLIKNPTAKPSKHAAITATNEDSDTDDQFDNDEGGSSSQQSLSDRFIGRLIRSLPLNGGSAELIRDLMDLASWLVAATPAPSLDNLRHLQAWIRGIQEREVARTPFRERLLALVQADTGRSIAAVQKSEAVYTSTGRACALKKEEKYNHGFCRLDHPTRFSIHLEMDQLDFNNDTRHANLDLILSVMAEEVATSMRSK